MHCGDMWIAPVKRAPSNYLKSDLISKSFNFKVPDMIHSIIPPNFFKHTAILVPKVESYFSHVRGEIGCENSM